MRKLLTFIIMLVLVQLGFSNNGLTKLAYKTYSVEAPVFTTDYMTFKPYHVNLDLGDVLQVKEDGDFKIKIDYQKGMQAGNPQKLTSLRGNYYNIPITSPLYKVTIRDKANNVVHEKAYGGANTNLAFGKTQNLGEVELSQLWSQEQKQFLQSAEFKGLNFAQLQTDIKELLPKLEADAPAPAFEPEPAPTPIAPSTDEPVVEDIFSDDYDNSVAPEFEPSTEKLEIQEVPAVEASPPITKTFAPARRNIVKLNLPNLGFKNVTLNYERILSDRTSAALNVGYIIPSAPPSFLSEALGIDSLTISNAIGADSTSLNNELSGFTATLEYRIYTKKKGAPRGFYLAPYLRYASYKYLFDDTIKDNFSNIDSRVTTIGVGAQLGYQWVIKDRFVIDWGILGIAAQRYKLSSTFSSMDDTVNFDEIQQDVETEIAGRSILSGTPEFKKGPSSLEATMPLLFGGLRTYLSVGMQF